MRATNETPKETHQTSSAHFSDDDDPTSSSGSSSEESESDSSEDEDEERNQTTAGASTIPSIPHRPKPRIKPMKVKAGSDLLSRLSAFLPQMKEANDDLEKEIAAGRGKDIVLDDADETDGKQYIEMNLGLGVLKEKREGDDSSEADSDDENPYAANGGSNGQGDSDVLSKLMGGKKSEKSDAEKPSIEEMAE
ncbi:hypothetical protein N7448_007885 [Penicillium atrosanguineum]|uniref:Uncharacterized protein n=1 Tax=Penicillium atrosanguineum TaxID=1132637 RepID=A0A9W9QCW7_9EURO|nr:uncharacterized protein N7443_001093 [Penicillium atrosanguineum]KAJ5127106.1 hypothetical protein N7448_007885 [Penicillium atrosanguineum]KAJ5147311.1 hypothetical protein N7526_000663 [Penicillium atrosanguineum]KAJ5314209.1 hypothetical protein N7443_001093 [Penicillium atrosanguineum]KAJ5331376.1 hypothetical protein N7476_001159 [Penicillium atrosanguineum]